MTKKHNNKAEQPAEEPAQPVKSREQELLEDLQRLQAEFENYQKRMQNERSQLVKTACVDIVKQIIPILDNFELALANADNKETSFYKGTEMIYSQMRTLLEERGIEEVPAEGKLNPALHEAVLAEDSDKEKNTILEILQRGYQLDGRIIRPAKVKVAR